MKLINLVLRLSVVATLLANGCAKHHSTAPAVAKEVAPQVEKVEPAAPLTEPAKTSDIPVAVVPSYVGTSGTVIHYKCVYPEDDDK